MRSTHRTNHLAWRVVRGLASFVTAAMVMTAMAPATFAADVNRALVGTWQLEWPGRPLY